MATGGAVICTDAHGNRDFCRDGVNCLMPEPTVEAVRGALERLLADPDLRRQLGAIRCACSRRFVAARGRISLISELPLF